MYEKSFIILNKEKIYFRQGQRVPCTYFLFVFPAFVLNFSTFVIFSLFTTKTKSFSLKKKEKRGYAFLNCPQTVMPPTHTFTHTAHALDIIRYINGFPMLFLFLNKKKISAKFHAFATKAFSCPKIITAHAGITNCKEI